eukprot:GFUD01121090.1.p1 GENE.GFUD01121090.1~~GFUD01121090.1.p1  ORF type:complete len:361 (-),score=82.37 GFUD01121090.1:66-1148(-)
MALLPAKLRCFDPVPDQLSSGNYHQWLSWKITEEAWNSDAKLVLKLRTKIPGTRNPTGTSVITGGFIELNPGKHRLICFGSFWPKEVKEENINIETIFKMKKGSEVRYVLKDLVFTQRSNLNVNINDKNVNTMMNNRTALPNPSEIDLYDENKVFVIEADILIKKYLEVFDSSIAPGRFVKDMKSIMKLEDISDLVIVCHGKVFKCHKTILCARSDVFKKMLSGDTLENLNREVPIEDSSAEAVDEMLKYIYTGEIPDYDKLGVLNIELLHLAEKYHLDPLKFACGGSIVTSLTISTCISDFITVERYFPPDSSVRKKVDQFLRCNAEQVVECEAWDDLVKKFPEVSRDLVRAMVKRGKD